MAIASPAVPGAAEAVKQSGRTDVKVIGLGLPNDNKPYVHDGVIDSVVLWNTMDLGYLTIQARARPRQGHPEAGRDVTSPAGRLEDAARSRATTSCWARRSRSRRTTSTSSTSSGSGESWRPDPPPFVCSRG